MTIVRNHGRFEYRAIHDRRDFTWPDRRRLAVYVGVNLEHFSFGEGLGGDAAGGDVGDELVRGEELGDLAGGAVDGRVGNGAHQQRAGLVELARGRVVVREAEALANIRDSDVV